jgi:hypothetical protein
LQTKLEEIVNIEAKNDQELVAQYRDLKAEIKVLSRLVTTPDKFLLAQEMMNIASEQIDKAKRGVDSNAE